MSQPAFFSAADGWAEDPIRPGMGLPTPDEIVLDLSTRDREARVRNLIIQADDIYELALAAHLDGHRLAASAVLYSGGNDSTTLAHLFRSRVTHAIHANTGIGVSATRDFVRATCVAWGLPLIEKHPPVSYRELVIERGFPGPAMHWKMYTRLKERCLDAARADLIGNPRRERVLFLAGRRRSESRRRAEIPLHERNRSAIWASPIACWTSLDLNTYRTMHDVPRNPVADLLHMSGECLCGAFAKPHELDEIGYWFPETADEIRALEVDVKAAGRLEPFCRWGHGQGHASKSGPLCSSCDIDFTGSPPLPEEAIR